MWKWREDAEWGRGNAMKNDAKQQAPLGTERVETQITKLSLMFFELSWFFLGRGFSYFCISSHFEIWCFLIFLLFMHLLTQSLSFQVTTNEEVDAFNNHHNNNNVCPRHPSDRQLGGI
jgi:hypothetical protein